MKAPRFFFFFFLLGSITSCQTNRNDCSDEVVCEAVHRYGVPLEPGDWSERGQHGQIISMRKDGVLVTGSYEAGMLHGECSYTFPQREVIQTKEIYHQGCLKQKIDHYSTGLPQRQTVFESPNRQVVTTWYESGAPLAYEEMEDENLVHGKYYDTNQQIESQVEAGNGIKVRRDGQGQLQSADTIQDGQMVLSTTYHPNGMPATTTPYAKGMIHGERRTYFPGGEPATIEMWANNAQHGTTQVFEQGEKRSEVPYVNGIKHGIERRYRYDGEAVAQEITWEQGLRHGPSYNYVGKTRTTDWYFRNQPVPNKATFDMLSNQ